MREILKRTLTGLSLVAGFTLCILFGPWSLTAILLLVYAGGVYELAAVYSEGRKRGELASMVAAGVLIPFIPGILLFQWSSWLLLLPLMIWFLAFLSSGARLPGLLSFWWLSLPLASFLALGWAGPGTSYESTYPLLLIIIVWINDTFAYLTGRFLGSHQMTPRLSPGKTWEGTAGGFLFSILSGWVVHRLTGTLNAPAWILLSGLIALLGLAGDLFESGIKRRKGVKNMGTLLPGHGGILDRFDSLLFAAPVILILLNWLS